MYYKYTDSDVAPTLRDLDLAGMEIFNDWWSTYVPEHKKTLIQKIMRTYYFEQIGSETPDRFIHHINAHLERIMPYYNQLYMSELIKINPLVNHSLVTNGRSIENMLSKVNATDDRYSRAVRDFVGLSDRAGNEDKGIKSNVQVTDDKQENTLYKKYGEEDITDHSKTDGTEDEKTHNDKVTNGLVTKNETENDRTTTDRDLDRTVTESPEETTTKEMNWGQTEEGTEQVAGHTTGTESGVKEWKEVKDNDAKTTTDTKLTETSRSSSEKDYADTPQGQLTVGSDGDTLGLRKDYLTNVTWNSENSSHNADTNQTVDYQEDETKDHNETSSGNNEGTSQTDTTKHHQKGGTDTETTTKGGQNVIDTVESEGTTKSENRDLNATTTDKTTVTDDGTRDLSTTEETAATRAKDWKEAGDSSTANTGTQTTDTVGNTTTTSTDTQNTRENSDTTDTSSHQESKDETETKDKGETQVAEGFMNVSASALLEAFRKTFLNIDSMIIEELRDNFMLVY